MSGYQPRSRFDRPAPPTRRALQTTPLPPIDPAQPRAPRAGEVFELDGRVGVVAIFDGGMNLVDVVWSDGKGSIWIVYDWKRLWGEK